MKSNFKSWMQVAVAVLLLALVVGVWASQAKSVAAAPPCSFCEMRLADCEEGCSTQQCFDDCWASVAWCFSICIE